MNTLLYVLPLLATLLVTACAGGSGNTRESTNMTEASGTNVQLAVGYIKRGEYEVAEAKLQKAIDQNPDNVEAYTMSAYLMMKLNRMEEAEDFYLEAIDIKKNSPELRNSYGAYLCKANRLDDAMAAFKEAYSNPFYNTPYLAYSNAGTCLLEAGDYAGAEKMLRKALKEQPQLSGALLSMAELGIKTEKYLMARAYIQRYHAVSKASAATLWVQVQAERALGAREHYLKYAKQLLNDFPDSEQAGLVGELARNDRIGDD